MSAPLNRLEVGAICSRIAEGCEIPRSLYPRIVATFEHLQEQAELLAQVAADLQRQVSALQAKLGGRQA